MFDVIDPCHKIAAEVAKAIFDLGLPARHAVGVPRTLEELQAAVEVVVLPAGERTKQITRRTQQHDVDVDVVYVKGLSRNSQTEQIDTEQLGAELGDVRAIKQLWTEKTGAMRTKRLDAFEAAWTGELENEPLWLQQPLLDESLFASVVRVTYRYTTSNN